MSTLRSPNNLNNPVDQFHWFLSTHSLRELRIWTTVGVYCAAESHQINLKNKGYSYSL